MNWPEAIAASTASISMAAVLIVFFLTYGSDCNCDPFEDEIEDEDEVRQMLGPQTTMTEGMDVDQREGRVLRSVDD